MHFVLMLMARRDTNASSSLWPNHYVCNHESESGALLLLDPAGTQTTTLSGDKHIRDYILKHIASWRTFARNHRGIDLEEKDLIFVSGYTMAAQWGVIAFRGARPGSQLQISDPPFTSEAGQKQWEVIITAPNTHDPQRTGTGSADAVSDMSNAAIVFARIGPMDRKAGQDPQMDQCVFIQYYKVKTSGILRSRRVIPAPPRRLINLLLLETSPTHFSIAPPLASVLLKTRLGEPQYLADS